MHGIKCNKWSPIYGSFYKNYVKELQGLIKKPISNITSNHGNWSDHISLDNFFKAFLCIIYSFTHIHIYKCVSHKDMDLKPTSNYVIVITMIFYGYSFYNNIFLWSIIISMTFGSKYYGRLVALVIFYRHQINPIGCKKEECTCTNK